MIEKFQQEFMLDRLKVKQKSFQGYNLSGETVAYHNILVQATTVCITELTEPQTSNIPTFWERDISKQHHINKILMVVLREKVGDLRRLR